jgi:hypothetical protein
MKVRDVASIIRSKNAGPFRITLDIIFDEEKYYYKMKNSRIWNQENIANLYNVPLDQIIECVEYDKALAFKCTLKRPISSGAFGDTDIYGSQQHVPLYSLEF